MERRRVPPPRPASSEEVQCWSHAAASLSALAQIYLAPQTSETIAKVNRLISAWPTDDILPAEGLDGVKTVYKKLPNQLQELQNNANTEAHALEEAIEHLGVLIALRKASESSPLEKRSKRPRAPSPSASAGTINPATILVPPPAAPQVKSAVSITIPSRRGSAAAPAANGVLREKARKDALAKQLPIKEGRKVAFHPPVTGKPGVGGAAPIDEHTWMLAVITRCLDRNRYEVQDAEPQEDGQPGQIYKTTLNSIVPLPDPTAHPSDPSHLDAFPEFHAGSRVMALYPDTSCFYRAEVIASPRENQPLATGRGAGAATKYAPTYRLKFEEDEDQEHSIHAQWVVERPGSL